MAWFQKGWGNKPKKQYHAQEHVPHIVPQYYPQKKNIVPQYSFTNKWFYFYSNRTNWVGILVKIQQLTQLRPQNLPKEFRNPSNSSKLERLGTFPLKVLKEKEGRFDICSKTRHKHRKISFCKVLPPLQRLPGLLEPKTNFQNQHCTAVHKQQVICPHFGGNWELKQINNH